MAKVLTLEIRKKIEEGLKTFLPPRDIAKLAGIARGTVLNECKRWKSMGFSLTDYNAEKAAELFIYKKSFSRDFYCKSSIREKTLESSTTLDTIKKEIAGLKLLIDVLYEAIKELKGNHASTN